MIDAPGMQVQDSSSLCLDDDGVKKVVMKPDAKTPIVPSPILSSGLPRLVSFLVGLYNEQMPARLV